jgi:hypothetical protein
MVPIGSADGTPRNDWHSDGANCNSGYHFTENEIVLLEFPAPPGAVNDLNESDQGTRGNQGGDRDIPTKILSLLRLFPTPRPAKSGMSPLEVVIAMVIVRIGRNRSHDPLRKNGEELGRSAAHLSGATLQRPFVDYRFLPVCFAFLEALALGARAPKTGICFNRSINQRPAGPGGDLVCQTADIAKFNPSGGTSSIDSTTSLPSLRSF